MAMVSRTLGVTFLIVGVIGLLVGVGLVGYSQFYEQQQDDEEGFFGGGGEEQAEQQRVGGWIVAGIGGILAILGAIAVFSGRVTRT